MKHLATILFANLFIACAAGNPVTQTMQDAAVVSDAPTGACSGCGANQMCCGTQCVDLTSTEAHCGACNVACGSGQTCTNSQCKCGGQTCNGAGQSCCGGTCVDTTISTVHCGTCGNACVAGQVCQGSACAQMPCNNNQGCASLQTCASATSCQCGSSAAVQGMNACPSGQVCVNAVGSVDPALRRCVDTMIDSGNCGRVGNRCNAPTSTCCAGNCVDLQTDVNHCGLCGRSAMNTQSNRCAAGVPVCGSRTDACPIQTLPCRCAAALIDPTPEAATCSRVSLGGALGC